jgi:hypothetical protein
LILRGYLCSSSGQFRLAGQKSTDTNSSHLTFKLGLLAAISNLPYMWLGCTLVSLAVTICKPTAYSLNPIQKINKIFTALCLKKGLGGILQ